MKKRLREKVWWVRIDKMIVNFVKACEGCLLVSKCSTTPMTRTPLPTGPWKKIAIDFTEIMNNTHLLVVVDYFSRYPEVEIMPSMTASATIYKLKIIFARFGYPEEIVCDNGPPFHSEEFIVFSKTCGIKINYSVPYSPFQNGMVERFNKSFLKTVKISATMGRDWKTDLQNFLLGEIQYTMNRDR